MPILSANLLSLSAMASQAPSISKRTLRYWLDLNKDGFRDSCSVKVGRMIFLDRLAVDAWLAAHRQADAGQEGVAVEGV